MEKIGNYNFEGMCYHKYCSERYTHCCYRKIYGMELALAFCEKHGDEFENLILEDLRKNRK